MKKKREGKESARRGESGLSRREFARGATVAAAALAALPAAGALVAGAAASPGAAGGVLAEAAAVAAHLGAVKGGRTRAEEGAGSVAAGNEPKLSAEAQAEVEAKTAEILRRYGERLNEAQKTDIRRLVREAQEPLETLRKYPLANSDEPATVLHVVKAEARTRRPPERRGTEGAKRPGA